MAMKMKKRTRPDAAPAPQAASPLNELFDSAAFEDDEVLSVEDILAEFREKNEDGGAPSVSEPSVSASTPPAASADPPADPEPAPQPEAAESNEDFEPANPEELADAEAAAVSMKSDIVGHFQSVDNIYRDLGVSEAQPEEGSGIKSMLKRWDLFALFQREPREQSPPDGVSAAQLSPETAPEAADETEAVDAAASDEPEKMLSPDEQETEKELKSEGVSQSRMEEILKKMRIDSPEALRDSARGKLQTLSSRLPKRKHTAADSIIAKTIHDTSADNNPAYAAPLDELSGEASGSSSDGPELRQGRNWNLKAAITGYFVSFLASIDTLRDKNGAAMLDLAAQIHDPEDDRDDVPPARASKLYGIQAHRLRPRALIGTVLAVLLLAISLFYLAGIVLPDFMRDIRFMAPLCLAIQLLVMLLGLDVFSTGVYNLIDGVPGMETLVSVSCIASVTDALVIFLSGSAAYGLPFSAVSALSMVFALWGSYFYCLGYRLSFRTLTQIQNPMVISSEPGLSEQGNTLLRSYGTTEHFIKRSEAPDLAESAYRLFTPLFLIVSLIFGLLSAVGQGEIGGFFHCFSACISACAAFPAFLCFAKPFAEAARKLRRKGCAVAGFAGCREIGSGSRIVVYDEDVFPRGTVRVEKVITSSEMLATKLTIYTASLLYESESALTPAFEMLLSRKGHAKLTVRSFAHQEGGGFSGFINEEQVLVGPAAFLDLMGIRIPQRLKEEASVFTAINGQLAGAFCLKYTTTTASREAFSSLFRSNYHPFFVVRDFNVTPMLIQQNFGASPSRFEFPPFSDRYRISAVQAEKPAAAVLSKNEIRPLADCVSICQQVYLMTRRAVLVSLTGSVVGLLAAFVLCWLGKFRIISAAVLSIFMLLWLIPSFIFSLKRK